VKNRLKPILIILLSLGIIFLGYKITQVIKVQTLEQRELNEENSNRQMKQDPDQEWDSFRNLTKFY